MERNSNITLQATSRSKTSRHRQIPNVTQGNITQWKQATSLLEKSPNNWRRTQTTSRKTSNLTSRSQTSHNKSKNRSIGIFLTSHRNPRDWGGIAGDEDGQGFINGTRIHQQTTHLQITPDIADNENGIGFINGKPEFYKFTQNKHQAFALHFNLAAQR